MKLIHNLVLLRLLAGVVSVALILFYEKLPDRRVPLLHSDFAFHSIYGPMLKSGIPSFEWLDEEADRMRCTNEPDFVYSCGYVLSLDNEFISGLDFTPFKALIIKLHHSGSAPQLRVALRNYNPAYALEDKTRSSKFMSVVVPSVEFKNDVKLNLSEFSVNEWWLKEFDIPREYSSPEFDRIISLGIDFLSTGANDVEVVTIELAGEWISRENLYLSVLVFWMVIIFLEGGYKIYRLYIQYGQEKIINSQLAQEYVELEKIKDKYENLSTRDFLTGAFNRAGIVNIFHRLLNSDFEKGRLGLILFDVDHFKRINDSHGHDVGDKVLVEIANLVKINTRDSDLFGRWGGEEFLLICPLTKAGQLLEVADNLREAISTFKFEPNRPLRVTISAGVTNVEVGENFEEVFKRLDKALYQAKNIGRNSTVYVE